MATRKKQRRAPPAYPPLPGALVHIPLPRGRRPLDGFLTPAARRRARNAGGDDRLLIFIHGMHSNFHHSYFKRELLRQAIGRGRAVLLFNNRGADAATATERFGDCLADIAAAIRFGRRAGYRRFILAGHSTGCQKAVYYQALRRDPGVRALVLLGPADDYAICRRDLGPKYARRLRQARRLAAAGRGGAPMPADCQSFSARRFLSIADPRSPEAGVFNYAGPLRLFRRIREPLLVLFGAREEYACRPLAEMGLILKAKTRSVRLDYELTPGADHGFHGRERRAVARIFQWLEETVPA